MIARFLPPIAIPIAVILSAPVLAAQGREYLTSPREIVVTPAQSAQAVITNALRTLDSGGQTVTIRLAAGTHGPIAITGSLVGDGKLEIVGDAGAIVDGGTAHAIKVNRGTLSVGGLTLQTSPAAAGACLFASDRSAIFVGAGMTFGVAGGEHIKSANNSGVHALYPYTVAGSAISHAHAFGHSTIVMAGLVTFVGSPEFGAYVVGASQSEIIWPGGWSGAALGQAALIHYSSLVFTGGQPLPGSRPGVITPESVYQ